MASKEKKNDKEMASLNKNIRESGLIINQMKFMKKMKNSIRAKKNPAKIIIIKK